MIAANVMPGVVRTQQAQPATTLCADCPLATQPWQTCLARAAAKLPKQLTGHVDDFDGLPLLEVTP